MNEAQEETKTKRKKNALSVIVDVILGLLVALMLYIEVSFVVTANHAGNYGVPSAFGHSFLYVATDSMVGDNPDSLNQGTGIIIRHDDPSQIKEGDVITFYYPRLQNPDTHRVLSIVENEDGTRTFLTRGDNLHAWSCAGQPNNTCPETAWESVDEKYYIGTVVWHSDGFGTFLTLVSPQAGAAAGRTAWLGPVLILVPILGIILSSTIDTAKQYRKEKKAYEQELHAAMLEAGVDPNDEKAALLFEEKYNYKKDLREQMEKEKAKEKARLRKELEKEAKKKNKTKGEE